MANSAQIYKEFTAIENNYAEPTQYRISTITSTGCVGTNIDLDILYNCIETLAVDDFENSGIVYTEYGKKKSETIFKGFSKKYSVNRRKVKPNKRFDNQVTIVYRTPEKNCLNIKTFRNGNLQVTGIKSINQGYLIVDTMIDILKNLYNTKNTSVIDNINNLQNINFKIRLINTDYKVGFNIKREILHKILKTDYGAICNYEPCIYPGVKMQYFYNKNNGKNGICNCEEKCHNTKGGEGNGEGNCKKITIAIFQSGCVIITGSQTKDQIDESYKYINNILYKNISKIEKKNMIPIDEQPINAKKIILIPKSKVKFI
jgi:TATA-box binding protein (TBP) (component of TFIID and TFIIIB)